MSAVESDAYQTLLYIDGQFTPAAGGVTFEVVNPSNEKILGHVAAAQPQDIDRAVNAAHRAFTTGPWPKLSGGERGHLLYKLADLIERDATKIARLESSDNGKLLGLALNADLQNTIATFRYFAGFADKLEGRSIPVPDMFGRPVLSYTVREPLGVIGAIGAYNAPTMYIAWKSAAALAAGNTVVFKPAEEAPLTALYIAGLFEEAGFPAGVVNVVPGLGPVAGMALAQHPLIAKLSYTGGGTVGRIIAAEAAKTLKPVTLELGGKAPQIVCEDVDLDVALPALAMGFLANQGQICAAGTRIFVHRSKYKDVVESLAAAATSQKIGDALDPETTFGPLSTLRSVDRVLNYVAVGQSDGAKLVVGGRRAMDRGYFVQPTLFTGTNDMKIAREEIFGPVATVIPFDTVEEAITLANDNEFGLNASVYTTSLQSSQIIARQLRCGAVWINGWGMIDPRLPWGGVKGSGYGRENSRNGLDDVTHEKVITTLL
jgi:betaine-aldehyde dehydrogenase